jgi:hypothetical protein
MQLPMDPRRTWFPAYGITLTILTTLFLGIRLVSRLLERKLGLDDAIITAGWAVSVVTFGFGLTSTPPTFHGQNICVPQLLSFSFSFCNIFVPSLISFRSRFIQVWL